MKGCLPAPVVWSFTLFIYSQTEEWCKLLLFVKCPSIGRQRAPVRCSLDADAVNVVYFTYSNTNQWLLFLFPLPDSSYDAVRRTGWSNNMHSGKGENTIIICLFLHNTTEHIKTLILYEGRVWRQQTPDYTKKPACCCIWAVEKTPEILLLTLSMRPMTKNPWLLFLWNLDEWQMSQADLGPVLCSWAVDMVDILSVYLNMTSDPSLQAHQSWHRMWPSQLNSPELSQVVTKLT